MHLRALALVAALLLPAWAWRASGAAGVPSLAPLSSPVITASTLRVAPPRPVAQNLGQAEKANKQEQKLTGLPRLRAVLVSSRETAQ